ncbi:MAG: acyl-CoA dehydrogenase family protein [Pseudomonadales bacterium]|nr:acyl-CoA dehydrogenase family protein [Pseudomonadales bacterium]
MDFSFSQEQTLLKDSVQRFLEDNYSFLDRQKLAGSEEGFSRKHWSTFAELGWLALPLPEDAGGFGGTAIETMILMEEFGKGLVLEPYVPSIVLGANCIAMSGNASAIDDVLPGILAGEKLAALAWVEPGARFELANVSTTASGSDDFTIDGAKGVVVGGPSADYFIVPARTSGARTDERGVTLFLVEAGAEGISQRNYRTIDGQRASELSFAGVKVPSSAVLGEVDDGMQLLRRVVDQGILAVSAEAVGAMEVMYKSTVEYCQTREQFGQPIGKFQVLQHKMVDMFMEHEQTKSLLYMAALRLVEGDLDVARQALSALKVRVGKAGRFVGQGAIQLHGGMGMTEEMAVGHYFKRVTAIDAMFGNADYHLKRYARAAA